MLASAPPVGGIPLAAYGAIALLLVGGMALLPGAMAWLLQWLQPLAARRVLAEAVLAERMSHIDTLESDSRLRLDLHEMWDFDD